MTQQYILYKENDTYKLTACENYNVQIRDVNKIASFTCRAGFENKQLVIDYITRYYHIDKNNIVDITEED